MLDICASVCDRLSVKVNNIKSHCIVFGKCRKRNIENMGLVDDSINWVESIKYLGVHIVGGKKLSFDIHALRRSFYAAFNNNLQPYKDIRRSCAADFT